MIHSFFCFVFVFCEATDQSSVLIFTRWRFQKEMIVWDDNKFHNKIFFWNLLADFVPFSMTTMLKFDPNSWGEVEGFQKMTTNAPTSADACLSIVHSLMCHRQVLMIFFLFCKELISFSLSDTQDLQETAHVLKLILIMIYRLSFLLHMELNFKMAPLFWLDAV